MNLDCIVNGDCDEGMAGMPDGSVDIIFTDPPYIAAEVIQAYRILSRHAPRVLKPGGFLITYSAQYHLLVIMQTLGEDLSWYWLCIQLNSGLKSIVWSRHAMCGFKPILIYQKPPVTPARSIFMDVVQGHRSKRHHAWEQSIQETLHLLSRIAEPGAMVLDPFTGSGTNLLAAKLLGLHFLGFEIDPATCEVARSRLQQAPLDLYSFVEVGA